MLKKQKNQQDLLQQIEEHHEKLRKERDDNLSLEKDLLEIELSKERTGLEMEHYAAQIEKERMKNALLEQQQVKQKEKQLELIMQKQDGSTKSSDGGQSKVVKVLPSNEKKPLEREKAANTIL